MLSNLKQALQDIYIQIIKNIIALKQNQRVSNFFSFDLIYYEKSIAKNVIDNNINIVTNILMQYQSIKVSTKKEKTNKKTNIFKINVKQILETLNIL